MVIGYTGDVTRFRSRDHFAAYTGTAPIEVSSGGRITHRLSRRGNRQLNHAIHITAITQIRYAHSPGHAFLERKVAESKTKREAVRTLKRRFSDFTIYRQLLIDANAMTVLGRATRDDSSILRGRLNTPAAGSSDQLLADPTERQNRHARTDTRAVTHSNIKQDRVLTTKRHSDCAAVGGSPQYVG